ncbi:hypothetical protein BC827DRAFT_1197911 [Russula dissimulans]|nr:hypothetical protein BC827DRAFT_1197911 [Russula dissimulans]
MRNGHPSQSYPVPLFCFLLLSSLLVRPYQSFVLFLDSSYLSHVSRLCCLGRPLFSDTASHPSHLCHFRATASFPAEAASLFASGPSSLPFPSPDLRSNFDLVLPSLSIYFFPMG